MAPWRYARCRPSVFGIRTSRLTSSPSGISRIGKKIAGPPSAFAPPHVRWIAKSSSTRSWRPRSGPGVLPPEDVGEIVVERTPPLRIEGLGPLPGGRRGGEGEALGPHRDCAEPGCQPSSGGDARDRVESRDAAGAQRRVDDRRKVRRRDRLRSQHS